MTQMTQMPIVKIELEGLRQAVATMFNTNNDELSKMVQHTLEQRLTEEWVQSEITAAVDDCIKKAITDVSSNWKIQQAITDLIADSIIKTIEPE